MMLNTLDSVKGAMQPARKTLFNR